MLLHIPEVLTPEELAHGRMLLAQADWADGRITAGSQSAQVKRNLQLPQHLEIARELQAMVEAALKRNTLFFSAALPKTVFPPLFNCYQGGMDFGNHVDNAVRSHPFDHSWVRTDVSCTLFFSQPDEYEGGELVVEDTYGLHSVKLPAGDMVALPLHQPAPGRTGHARRAHCLVFLDAKHDPGRCQTWPAVRHGHGHFPLAPATRRHRRTGDADGELSQPAAHVG